MKTIGILALAFVAALVLGFGVRSATPTAHADVDSTVVIGCEFLGGAIDGDPDDVATGADAVAACDGIDATDVANLGDGLGDEDGTLEADDFTDIDLDDNQIRDNSGADTFGMTYAFAFVDNDGTVTFDADTGLDVAINASGDAAEAAPADDANTETCDGDDDADCGTTTLDNGDGVVVATLIDGTADAGDTVDVDIEQDATGTTETIAVTGVADEITLEAVAGKTTIQSSGSAGDVDDCNDDLDISDTGLFGEANITALKATVVDSDETELTRAVVTLDTSDDDVVELESDSGEPGSDPSFDTGISVNAGDLGIGYFFYICGGTTTGDADITALINEGLASEEDSSVTVTVVGEPANIALTAAPAQIACDGTATSTVTATVTDSEGNNVANGVDVNFSVVALGTANPINTSTTDGTASSTITPLSNASAGVTVIVTSGDAQSSIRVDCSVPIPTQPTAVPSGTPGGTIRPPDTGNGGYLGQDGSAGFPVWALIALAAGTVALVAGGMVTRKAGR